jgi:serine/threonine-protein phosphatase 2B catalytic subunit
MMQMLKVLKDENEAILQLKGMCPDNRIPKGLLQEGKGAIYNAIESFKSAQKLDLPNEKRPE